MEHYVGIDVSLELSSLCVLDATGKGVGAWTVEVTRSAGLMARIRSDARR